MLRSALVAGKGAIRRQYEQRLPLQAPLAQNVSACSCTQSLAGATNERPLVPKLERRFHLGHAPLRGGGDQGAGSGALVLRCARGIARALLDRAGIIARALRAHTIALALRST